MKNPCKHEGKKVLLVKGKNDCHVVLALCKYFKLPKTFGIFETELQTFDDELRHYADMKISLDLDDGVKVNYGKFGNLLDQKKAITGKK